MQRSHPWVILAAAVLVLLAVTLWPGNKITAVEVPPVYGRGLPAPETPAAPPEPGHFYIITVDRLTIQDMMENTSFVGLVAGGAVGLVSTGVEGSLVSDSTFASIGAGAPLNASGTEDRGMNAGEQLHGMLAGEVFRQRTGLTPPGEAVLQLDIARLKKLNENSLYAAVPGLLGSTLRENGYPVRVFGNSDLAGTQQRPAVALAMDTRGIVEQGDVGADTTLLDPLFPDRVRTDYDALLELLGPGHPPGLTVVELGDLERLEGLGNYLEAGVLKARRQETMARMADFIETVIARGNPAKDRVLVVSPTPRGNTTGGTNYVTPVLYTGAGVEPGLLTSATTRRPGIIKNTDLTATVLKHFNLDVPARVTGRELQVIKTGPSMQAGLTALYDELELKYRARTPVLRYYVLVQLILVLLSLAAILIPGRKPLMPVLKPLLLAVMAVPLALLLVPLLPQATLGVTAVQLLAVTTGITALIHQWLRNYENELDPFIIISLLTSLCIIVDLLLGGPLQKNSLLGYDPVVGARFYGVGNEYMGVLLGSTIFGTTALATRLARGRMLMLPAIGAYYLLTLYIIAAPQLGTNVGGSIAGAGSFLVTMLLLAGVKMNFKTLLKIAGAVGVLLSALIFYDLQRPGESQSHIGRTAQLILTGGPAEIAKIIQRKISMNIKLLRYTIWSRVFLASLFSLAILFYRPVGVMQSINQRYPEMYRGFIGVVTASLLALVFNDSGVVAAATAMIFGAPPLLYLVIRTLVTEQK